MLPELSKIKQPTSLDQLSYVQLKELQKSLNKIGFDCGKVDGILGFLTEKAFYDFKKHNDQGNLSMIGSGSIGLIKEQLKTTSSNQKINSAGLNLIKEYEGLRLQSYMCPSNYPTIGYGSCYYPDGRKVKLGETITKQQAEDLLKVTVEEFEQGVSRLVKVPINSNQFSSLVSFTFNIGLGAFQSSTLLEKLNKKDYNGAANEFLKWNKGRGGKVLAGLSRRRAAEKKLFLSSV